MENIVGKKIELCKCYTKYDYDAVYRCNGTRHREICCCGGDESKCDFYPKVREKAFKEKEKISDEQELKLLRQFLREHDMIWEFMNWVERNNK